MNLSIRTALAVALGCVAVGLAGAAQATCYVDIRQPVGLGVCASVKDDCVHAAVYTTTPQDPDPLVCI